MDNFSSESVDERISAAVRALAALNGVKHTDLKDVLGIGQNSIFTKLRGDSPWKASEVAALAEYFDVPISYLFDGFSSLRNKKTPAMKARAFGSAPSGIRTPDPLIKSQLL